jgi:hypothetical protein
MPVLSSWEDYDIDSGVTVRDLISRRITSGRRTMPQRVSEALLQPCDVYHGLLFVPQTQTQEK